MNAVEDALEKAVRHLRSDASAGLHFGGMLVRLWAEYFAVTEKITNAGGTPKGLECVMAALQRAERLAAHPSHELTLDERICADLVILYAFAKERARDSATFAEKEIRSCCVPDSPIPQMVSRGILVYREKEVAKTALEQFIILCR